MRSLCTFKGLTVSGATSPTTVLYVATMHDVVYAFDANKPGPPLWIHDYRSTGVTPGIPFDTSTASDGMGIVGTPVIDIPTHKMYLVTETMENGAYVQRLHALDIRSGVDLTATVITATANGRDIQSGAADSTAGLGPGARPGLARICVDDSGGFYAVARMGDDL